MKKIFLCCWLFFLFSLNSRAQGSDVIFWIDNSGSISVGEYNDMRTSIQAIIQNVITCNPSNRFTIVQYGSPNNAGASRIWIESDFTNVAFGFNNRNANVGPNDYAHEALGLIGNALDGQFNANILGVPVLNQIPSNNLVIYLFTDASRANTTSAIVNTFSPTVGTANAFQNYTNFKNNRNATFIVTLISTNNATIDAAAAIASGGGSYTGVPENYPGDPDAGATGRYLLSNQTFLLTLPEIDLITQDICSIAQPNCLPIVLLSSTVDDVSSGVQDNRQASDYISASNVIGNNGVGIYHGANQVVMTSGFHTQSGSRFRAYIEDCSGNFNGREAKENTEKNSLPESSELFELYPNPTNGIVSISNSEVLKSISILSIEGRLMFNKVLSENFKSYELDITNYKNGLYIVNIETVSGKTLTKKLIKN